MSEVVVRNGFLDVVPAQDSGEGQPKMGRSKTYGSKVSIDSTPDLALYVDVGSGWQRTESGSSITSEVLADVKGDSPKQVEEAADDAEAELALGGRERATSDDSCIGVQRCGTSRTTCASLCADEEAPKKAKLPDSGACKPPLMAAAMTEAQRRHGVLHRSNTAPVVSTVRIKNGFIDAKCEEPGEAEEEEEEEQPNITRSKTTSNKRSLVAVSRTSLPLYVNDGDGREWRQPEGAVTVATSPVHVDDDVVGVPADVDEEEEEEPEQPSLCRTKTASPRWGAAQECVFGISQGDSEGGDAPSNSCDGGEAAEGAMPGKSAKFSALDDDVVGMPSDVEEEPEQPGICRMKTASPRWGAAQEYVFRISQGVGEGGQAPRSSRDGGEAAEGVMPGKSAKFSALDDDVVGMPSDAEEEPEQPGICRMKTASPRWGAAQEYVFRISQDVGEGGQAPRSSRDGGEVAEGAMPRKSTKFSAWSEVLTFQVGEDCTEARKVGEEQEAPRHRARAGRTPVPETLPESATSQDDEEQPLAPRKKLTSAQKTNRRRAEKRRLRRLQKEQDAASSEAPPVREPPAPVPVSDASTDLYTTVTLRNLPPQFSRRMLLDLLSIMGFGGKFDFVYLPLDFQTYVPLGFAFVNFKEHVDALSCFARFRGFRNWAVPSARECVVVWSPSNQQGLDSNIERYRNTSLMHSSVAEERKPLMLVEGMPVPFPPPTRRAWRTHPGKSSHA